MIATLMGLIEGLNVHDYSSNRGYYSHGSINNCEVIAYSRINNDDEIVDNFCFKESFFGWNSLLKKEKSKVRRVTFSSEDLLESVEAYRKILDEK